MTELRKVFLPENVWSASWMPAKEFIFLTFGALAQLGERLVCNQEVAGSIPVRSIPPLFFWLAFRGISEVAACDNRPFVYAAVFVDFQVVLSSRRQRE